MTSERSSARHTRAPGVAAALYVGVFLTGVTTVLLGPLIPEIRETWQVSVAEAASLFVAQFVSSSLGALVSSFHLRRSLVSGFVLTALGLGLLSTAHWELAWVAMGLVGLGLGLTVPASNLVFALQNPDRRGAALSTMNLVWGLGAVTCPLLFAAARGRLPATWLLALGAVACAVVSVVLAARLGEARLTPVTAPTALRSRPASLLLLAAMLFLYVGIETSIGGWLVTVSDEIGSTRTVASLLIGSGFWAAILLGRSIAPVLLKHRSETALYVGALVLSGLGTLALLASTSRGGVALGSVAAGLGLAVIFPLTVSLLAAETSASGSRNTGWVFAFGGIGGASLPWLSARMAGDSADLTRGFVIPALGLATLSLLYAWHRRMHRKEHVPDAGRSPSTGLKLSVVAALLLCTSLSQPAIARQDGSPLESLSAALSAAERNLQMDELQLAESWYRAALSEAWQLLGSIEMAERRLEESRLAYERAALVAVETREAHTALALVNLQLGRADEALGLLRGILARDPGDIESQRLLAQALSASGQPELALQELEEAFAAAPENLENAYALAMGHLNTGRIERAEELFARIVRERPIAQTHVLLGRTYRDFRQYERARAELLEALEMDPRVRRAHYYLGTLDLLADGRGRIADAITRFSRELELDPQDPVVNLYLGMALVENREPEAAIPALDIASRDLSSRAEALRHLGRAHLALGQLRESVESFSAALETLDRTGGEDRTRSSVHYQMGVALRQLNEMEEAAMHFARAEELGARLNEASQEQLRGYLDESIANEVRTDVFVPEATAALGALSDEVRTALRAEATAALARSYLNLGVMKARAQQYPEAGELLEQAAAIDPDFPQVQHSLGVARFNAEQFGRATDPLQRALEQRPGDPNLRRMLAMAWLNTEAYEQAAALLADDPERGSNPSLQYAYGLALVRSDRASEAQPVFEALMAGNRSWPELHVLLGQAHAQQGDYETAISSLRRALELNDNVPDARSTLGFIYLTQGELDEAEAVLAGEIALRPLNDRTQYLLATVLDLNRRPEEALVHLRTLLARRPRFADGRYLMGKILLAQGEVAEAAEQLEAAAGLSPEDPNIHYQLGQAYQRLGRTELANQAFARFRELKDQQRGGAQ